MGTEKTEELNKLQNRKNSKREREMENERRIFNEGRTKEEDSGKHLSNRTKEVSVNIVTSVDGNKYCLI